MWHGWFHIYLPAPKSLGVVLGLDCQQKLSAIWCEILRARTNGGCCTLTASLDGSAKPGHCSRPGCAPLRLAVPGCASLCPAHHGWLFFSWSRKGACACGRTPARRAHTSVALLFREFSRAVLSSGKGDEALPRCCCVAEDE